MRFKGTLTAWNDERGFGFLQSAQGGEAIFVHATAFGARAGRPQVGQTFSFEIEAGPRGRKRAKNVLPARTARARRPRGSRRPAPWSTASLFAIPLFLGAYAVITYLWRPPLAIAGMYAVASLAAFLAYALDKSAAARRAWRIPERTLHLLALACGWPGALLAQQVLRHKSAKAEFRIAFWATVILNVAGLLVLCSPWGRRYWAAP